MNQSKGNSPNESYVGNSPAAQRLEHHTSTAEGLDSIPGQGTKTPQAKKRGQKGEREKRKKIKRYATFYKRMTLRAKSYGHPRLEAT